MSTNTSDDKEYKKSENDFSDNINTNIENNNELKTESGKTYRSKIKYDVEYQKRDYVREKMKVYKKKYYENNKEEICKKIYEYTRKKIDSNPELKQLEKEKKKIRNKQYREKIKLEKIKNDNKYLPLPFEFE